MISVQEHYRFTVRISRLFYFHMYPPKYNIIKKALSAGSGEGLFNYFAYSIALLSLIRCTLICPG